MSDFRELTAAEMTKFLSDRGACPSKVVKVLIIGNSGAGKSLLCNCIVGGEVFAHKTQANSTTAVNTFLPVIDKDSVYVICNVPGLIEADANNIARNKAAIDGAFRFIPDAPTVCLFVACPTGGRIKNEDYQAIASVKRFVNIDKKSIAFVVNGVKFDEFDDDGSMYRLEAEEQVHAMVDAKMRVVLTPYIPRRQRDNYESHEMLEMQALLITLLRDLTPVRMQPEPGAELVLENERLRAEFEALKAQLSATDAAFQQLKANESQLRSKMAQSDAEHAQRLAAMEQQLVELRKLREADRDRTGGRRGGGGFCTIM